MLQIKSDGTAAGTFVYDEEGKPLTGIQEISYHIGSDDLMMCDISVSVRDVEFLVPVQDVTWHGLEEVPIEALRAELKRREDHEEVYSP